MLLDAGLDSGAFYLAGYGVELALKALLTRDLSSYVLPDKKAVDAAHTHDLRRLAEQAGLDPESDANVRVAWNVVTNWGPESRYQEHSATRAREMVESAEEVVKWLKPTW